MYPDHPPVLLLPTELPDEAAAQTPEILYELARLIENHYADQLRRYQFPLDEQHRPPPEQTDTPS